MDQRGPSARKRYGVPFAVRSQPVRWRNGTKKINELRKTLHLLFNTVDMLGSFPFRNGPEKNRCCK
jgi:hypothetical protein